MKSKPETLIKPNHSIFNFQFSELWEYRDLLMIFVRTSKELLFNRLLTA